MNFMKRLLALILSVMLTLSLVGCDSQVEEEATDTVSFEKEENNIINLQMREADTLDPILTQRQSVRDALLTAYEPLFNINGTFGLEPVLATSYAFNENATIMTLRIKESVLWHNGQVLSSDDIVYTVNKIKANPQSSYYLNVESIDRVERLSDYEVVFYLNKPDAQLVYSLYFPIVRTDVDISTTIMGTGPYMFKEMDGKDLILTKNMAWHMGNAECDGVKFLCMRTGAMAQEAFSSGKIHAVTKEMLDTENFAIKESNTRHIYPNGLFEFIGFNAQTGIFADPLLRIAVSNAVDRSTISSIYGDAIASGFPIMMGSSAFSPSYETGEYNLDYAKEVIFSAGWIDTDYDSKPEKVVDEGKQMLAFTLLVASSDPLRAQAAAAVKEELELAGFTVIIETVDVETYNERIKNGEYEAFLGAVYYDAPYDTANILSSEGSINFSGYSGTEMDVAIAEFSSATEIERASVAFSKLQSLYIAYQPIAGLVFRTSYIVTSPYIEGDVLPYPYSPYANIAKWKLGSVEQTVE